MPSKPNQQTTAAPRLPGPEDRPERDVVIYDGNCRICCRQIERLAWWDRGGRLAYISLHDPRVARRYPDLSHDRLMEEMFVVTRDDRRYGGAEAIRYLSRRLPGLWWLMPLMHLPGTRSLWRRLYRQVAASRYRFGQVDPACGGGTCHLHAATDHDRPARE